MNILQINTSDTRGGAGKVAYLLKNELAKMGHQTSFLVSRKYSEDDDVKLIRPYSNLRRRILKKLSYYLANDLDLFPSGNILRMQEFKNADIIHCHNLHTNYFNLNLMRKISAVKPVIWTFHDMWPITAHCAHAFDGELKKNGFFTCPSLDIYPPIAWHNERYLEKRKREIYQRSNFYIVTPSKWLADKVSQSVLRDKSISVIYNGVDTDIFRPYPKSLCRKDLGLPQDKKIVLIVAKKGKLNPWKGGNYAESVKEFFADNPNHYFINLGGIENKTEANARIVSYVSDPEILAKFYSAADILLYPSIADNCPLVILEAIACGLPAVSFNTGGIPELIEHKKTGYIAAYRDSEDLKNGLELMLRLSPEELKKMSDISRENAVVKFNIKIMAGKYAALYQSVQQIFRQNLRP